MKTTNDPTDAVLSSKMPIAVVISGAWVLFTLPKPSWQMAHILYPVESNSSVDQCYLDATFQDKALLKWLSQTIKGENAIHCIFKY